MKQLHWQMMDKEDVVYILGYKISLSKNLKNIDIISDIFSDHKSKRKLEINHSEGEKKQLHGD